jgi:hypothetical protein
MLLTSSLESKSFPISIWCIWHCACGCHFFTKFQHTKRTLLKIFALLWWFIMFLALLEGYSSTTMILHTLTNNMGKFKNLKCFPLNSPNFQVDLLTYKAHKSCKNLVLFIYLNNKFIKFCNHNLLILHPNWTTCKIYQRWIKSNHKQEHNCLFKLGWDLQNIARH